jgi:hypothetical protein
MDEFTKTVIIEMLDNPTTTVEMFAGMKKVSGDPIEYEPDGSKTVVIKFRGGANNVRVERIKVEGEEED